jgi:hypothetical protein
MKTTNVERPEKKTEKLSYKERNRNHNTKPGQRLEEYKNCPSILLCK